MSDNQDKLYMYDRWAKIIRLLRSDQVTSVDDFAKSLGVSLATVRRDLNELHDEGKLRRVRGGTVALAEGAIKAVQGELLGQAGFDDSSSKNSAAKKKIGQRAAELVDSHSAIIIDGGSSTLELARRISSHNVTVLTTSIPILSALLGREGIRVMITGGEVFQKQNIVLNPYGDGIVDNFSASKVFIGAQALTARGLMQTDPLLVQNEKNLIKRADEVIVLADSSKFNAQASLSVCQLDQIDTLVTDAGISAAAQTLLRQHGVNLIIAE